MKYLFKFLMLLFSLGILLYPAQNNISQNSKVMPCCSMYGVCHKNLPEKNHKNSGSKDCCNITVSIIQFIKQNETVSTEIVQKNNFKNKVSFFYSNSLIPNTLLEGFWQPPKFI
jgi:hypothetical protein